MRFEHKHQPVLPPARFIIRLIRSLGLAATVIFSALAIGVLGYHCLEGIGWIDSLLNASMILGGMGPVTELHADAAKIFASAYALFSGIIFLTVSAVLFVPILHRVMHHFHWEPREPRG